MRITVLGSGTSNGVPVIGCDCRVCQSDDPRDRRTRPSIAIEAGETTIAVDTTPELRLQFLANGIRRLDAVVYTHEHADHIYGLDDVRVFSMRRGPLPVYGRARVLDTLRRAFAYIFSDALPRAGGGKPSLDLRVVDGPFEIQGVPFEPIVVWHGQLAIDAYRIGDFAYVTDVGRIDDASMDRLRGLDVLILDALREARHPTHFSLAEALATIEDLRPRRAFLTHICHEMKHGDFDGKLPAGVAFAYDGLRIEIDDPPIR
ncbi:MAG: MBL fold metallo-hydrolase [Chloroflexota bacterium]|nr:MAG: MBL fold metallo-hydrolase [Chloroflexota bacterium]